LKKRTIYYLLADILVVTAAFLFFIWIKPASKRFYLPEYFEPFLLFLFIWVSVSLAVDKYRLHRKKTYNDVLFPIIAGDVIILAAITALIYAFQQFQYSRMIVFGTIAVSFALEFLLGYLFFTGVKLRRDADHIDAYARATSEALKKQLRMVEADEILKAKIDSRIPPLNKELVIDHAGREAFTFIKEQIDPEHMFTLLVATTTLFNIENQPEGYYRAIVNLKKVNNIQRINRFFETVNSRLPLGGIFIGCVQTNVLAKQKILKNYPPVLNYLVYIPYFLWKRVAPKLPVVKRLYFFITRGRNRALSRAETFGRLYSCGFEVTGHRMIRGLIYFSARKIQAPAFDYHPTYGPLIRLKRIGKGGRTIYVYKLRTMHPYSEYLQQYVYEHSKLEEGGKFRNDFRVHTLGRFMRRFWLDELPMLFNLLKGDLKPVGVRPLSRHYFDLYDETLKAKRIHTRPGLIPPFYADMPGTLEEIQDSENKYLDEYFRRPFLTDCRYFHKAMYNIIFRKARSR
jgi:hypothetical protein